MRKLFSGVCAALTLGLLAAGLQAAQAQDNSGSQAGRRLFGGLLSPGGYFFSNGSARAAFGDTYFYGETNIFARPKIINNLELTGGLQIASISSHFLPFTGGSHFTLVGPAFRLSTRREVGKPRPYLDGGLYYGTLQSDRLNIDKDAFVPGLAVGVEYPINSTLTLSAGYRVQGQVGGVDTNGFMVMLRIF